MSKVKKKHYRQLFRISKALLLEESDHIRLILKTIIVSGFILVAFLVWSAVVTLKEVAITFGEVVPEGQVQVIQHLEGGLIKGVQVKNGQRVNKDQVLLRFEPTGKKAELAQLKSREIALILDRERLRAYLNHRDPSQVNWNSVILLAGIKESINEDEVKKIIKDEKSHLSSQNQQRLDSQNVLKMQISQRREKLSELINQKKVWKKHIELLTQQFDMYHKLRQKSLVSHKDYLIVLREMNQAKGQFVSLTSQIQQTRQNISEYESKLNQQNSNLSEEAKNQLGKVENMLLEVTHQIAKIQDQLTRMVIKSPISGYVKGLELYSGNVVKPGEKLLEIVPLDQRYIIESRIEPRDIGHIRIGDQVNVKLLTYDYARYGSIQGKLIKVSASTFEDKDEKPYYKATVELNKQYIGYGKRKRALRAGMTAQADIVTGEKTLLQYLLKPIQSTTAAAFRER